MANGSAEDPTSLYHEIVTQRLEPSFNLPVKGDSQSVNDDQDTIVEKEEQSAHKDIFYVRAPKTQPFPHAYITFTLLNTCLISHRLTLKKMTR